MSRGRGNAMLTALVATTVATLGVPADPARAASAKPAPEIVGPAAPGPKPKAKPKPKGGAKARAKAKGSKGPPKGPPKDPIVAKAKEHFYAAEKLYKAKKFEEALEEYQKAYEMAARPAILFNIAQCHRNVGRVDDAVSYYRRYLEGAPSAKNHAAVERLVATLEGELDRERERVRAEEETARKAAAAALPAPASMLPPPPAVDPSGAIDSEGGARRGHGVLGRWWFWTIVAGVAVVGGTAGGVLAVTAGGERPDEVIDHR